MSLTRPLWVDTNVVHAIEMFFVHGISPGSFTSLMLQEKYNEALERAHPLIKNEHHHNDMICFLERYVPSVCKGDNFNSWKGYRKEIEENPELLVMIRLGLEEESIISSWIEKFNSVFS